MIGCRHLEASSHAVEIDEQGNERPALVYLCGWCDAHEDAVERLPPWAAAYVRSGGPTFDPDVHCRDCPGFVPFDVMEMMEAR